MSRQESAANRTQAATTSTPSRLVRTNQNASTRPPVQPPVADPPAIEEAFGLLGLLPTKVSSLDKNVMFQDMDKNKSSAYQSTNASRANNPTQPQFEPDKAIGLISNAFMGSTNKFVKGALNNPSTPSRAEQEQPQDAPQETAKGTPAKFSRNKDIQPKTRTISMREPPPEAQQLTDRSGADTGKKIERRQGANRDRELKFTATTEKKEEKVESTPDKVAPTVVLSARKNEGFKLETVKVEVEAPKEEKTEEFVPRVYQSTPRQPYARSRIVTEQPPVVEKEPEQEKPKVQQKPVITNRLVQSRLQAQLSESKVETKPPEKEVKPTVANKTTESRVLTEATPAEPPPQPKEEVKPKPFSRSFISRKPEQPVEQVVEPQPAVTIKQSPLPKQTLQESKIIEAKSKPEVKESRVELKESKVEVREARVESRVQAKEAVESSDVKLILKKTGCIALVAKRLVRNRLVEAFSALKGNRQADRLKKINECQIICCSASSIVRVKQTNLLKTAFESIKKRFAASYITSLKPFVDAAPSAHKNAIASLLDQLFVGKVRTSFKVLKNWLEQSKNKAKCLVALDSLYRQKTKAYVRKSFDCIRLRQKNVFGFLTQLSAIHSSVNKLKVAAAFLRLASVKPAAVKVEASPVKQQTQQRSRIVSKLEEPTPVVNNTSNQGLIDKMEKLKKLCAATQGEISSVEAATAKRRKAAEAEKGGLTERVTVLRHQNEQATNELEIKKHRSGQIKREMEGIPKKVGAQEEALPEGRQARLELLTSIYISHFKNAEDTLSPADLLSTHSLRAEDGSVLFHEWTAILRNVELKRLIAAYEGVDPRDNKGRANLVAEQALVSRLIRSYVKEQYFWQWIHLSAQTA